MNEQSSWDLPLPKQHTNANNKQVLGQKPMEKKGNTIIFFKKRREKTNGVRKIRINAKSIFLRS